MLSYTPLLVFFFFFSSCLHLSDFLAPDKETIISKEKALKSQPLKGIRVK